MAPGRKLKAWRGERTQAECAAAVGVSQAVWCEYERGSRFPRASVSIAIEDLTDGAVTVRDWAAAKAAREAA